MIKSILNKIRLFMTPTLRRLAGVPNVLLEEMPDCPNLFHSYRTMIATGHKRVAGGWIYEAEFYPDYLTVGGNTFAIRRTALKYCKGIGLDIGASYWPLTDSMPIDTESGPGIINKIEDVPDSSQDYVYSSHCLEHIEDWKAALDVWISKLQKEGILFLYLPHPSCKLWHRTNPILYGTHKWVPDPDVILSTLTGKGLSIIDKDDGPDQFYSFYICAKKQ